MASVKAILKCIGADTGGQVSILRRLFGFTRARVPAEQVAGVVAKVSLLRLVRDLQGPHFHLNVIRVGFDTLRPVARAAAIDKLDYALYRIRNIYRPIGLGVGRVEHFFIDSVDANGRDDIGSPDEADLLWDEFSVPGDALDVFMVRTISGSGFAGVSPLGGSCEKVGKDDGLVGGDIGRGFEEVARTFAHEIGHFLGRDHNHDKDECPTSAAGLSNLMAATRCVQLAAGNLRNSVRLTAGQGATMRGHCSIRNGC